MTTMPDDLVYDEVTNRWVPRLSPEQLAQLIPQQRDLRMYPVTPADEDPET